MPGDTEDRNTGLKGREDEEGTSTQTTWREQCAFARISEANGIGMGSILKVESKNMRGR